MKKLTFLLLVPFLIGCKNKTNDVTPTSEHHYERVVIFGVDGAGAEFGNIDTPNFDRIFGSGCIKYDGLAQSPTISAQNWGSMFYSVPPSVHGKNNGYIAENKHTDENLPTFVKTYSLSHPTAKFYSAVNWTPINYGLFEDIPNLTKDNLRVEYSDLSSAEIDEKVAAHVVARAYTENDTIVFMDFDSVDLAGHNFGRVSEEYVNSIKHIDTLLGSIYDAYVATGKADKTLFMCVVDHGHTATGGHGGESKEEKDAMIAVNGAGGHIIQGACDSYTTIDVAPIALHALREPIPAHYQGRVPNNMFASV